MPQACHLTIFGHDILPASTIFECDLPSKPDKSAPIADLEKYLMRFPAGDFSVIIDFMSKINSVFSKFSNIRNIQTSYWRVAQFVPGQVSTLFLTATSSHLLG